MKTLNYRLRTVLTVALLVLAVALTGCSGTPDAGDIEHALQSNLDESYGLDAIEVSDVEILKSSTPDKNRFKAKTTYTLTFNKGLEEYMEKGLLSRDGMTGLALQLVHGEFKKGDKTEVQAQVDFTRTEDGWRFTDTR